MSSPTHSAFKADEGDWICASSQCNNTNFSWRNSCNKCGKEKSEIPSKKKLGHEIGKAAAEKSRGLFSADDWQCGRCGNVNWARRSTCNMCNAPKFGDIEERTGLGGGYNERENVEYIERDDSDGEYDEFGRKKKRYRGNETVSSKTKDSHKSEKVSQYEEEEDEEDDDDEDGDLSKYDLSGWGDDDDDDGTDKKQKKSSSSKNDDGESSSGSDSSRSPSPKNKSNSKRPQHSRSRSNSPVAKRSRKESSSSGSSSAHSRSKSPVNRKR